MNMGMKRKYGWRPGLPDHRDLIFAPSRKALTVQNVDLRDECPPIVDQKALGSCTANAIAGAHEFCQMKEGEAAFPPSRLFIYFNERAMEGTTSYDAGAVIRDGCKSIAKQGVCPEAQWPYIASKLTKKPMARCYADALAHQAIKYMRVSQTVGDMTACLAAGFPFVFGISVYESFESDAVAKTGIVPMPKASESCLGGHAMLCVGWDRKKGQFIFRNSWGPKWGDKGYGYIPVSYMTSPFLASDFWTVRVVE